MNVTSKIPTYAHAKGARAAARKALGNENFTVTREGDRFGWVATEEAEQPEVKKERHFQVEQVVTRPPMPQVNHSGSNKLISDMYRREAEQAEAETEQAEHDTVENELHEEMKPSAAASAFGAFALGQLGQLNKPAEKQVKAATPKQVRTPNEVQNGARRPSPGTLCREVWDEMDAMVAAGTQPDSKNVKALAVQKGWNLNNASIEFYQWRKFNGIKSR